MRVAARGTGDVAMQKWRRRFMRIFATSSMLGFCSGCEADFSGLEDILNARPTYVNLPGRRVAEGRFQGATIDGSEESGAYVVAFDVDTDSRLAIVPIDGGEGCRTAPAQEYLSFVHSPSSGLDLFIPYVEPGTDAHPRRLHLTRPDCSEPLAPIENSGLPSLPSWSFEDPVGFPTLTSDDKLVFADPWNGRLTVVAENVRAFELTPTRIWTIESTFDLEGEPAGAQIVVRDYKFSVRARYGTNVVRFDVTTTAVPRTAFVEEVVIDPALPPRYDVYVLDHETREIELLAQDACRVSFPSSWEGLGLFYHQPCEDRRLVLHKTLERRRGGYAKVNETYAFDGPVISAPVLQPVGDRPIVFYLTGEPGARLGTLWGARLGGTPEKIGDSVRGTPDLPVRGKWRIRVDIENDVGRLVEWSPGSSPRELATRVRRVDGSYALVDFDGTVGNAAYVGEGGSLRILGRGVPSGGMATDVIGQLLLTDYDGKRGRLMAAELDSFDYEPIAEGVPVNGFGFVLNLDAVGYLRDYDEATRTGILGVRVLESADTFDIGIRASEWQEVFWPDPGLLYVVPEGDGRGIWLARLL